MLISYEWLKDYVDITESPEDVAKILTRIGLAVESITGTGNDAVLNIEVTTNRPDCLGHLGVAREFAMATGRELKLPETRYDEGSEKIGGLAALDVQSSDLCPRYTARVIRGIKLGESPDWLKRRLTLIGLRPINNIVDVTNFVLYEYSQPLHSFDYSLLNKHKIIVRKSREKELMVLLDGAEIRLPEGACVIADPVEAVALAGIMGGANSEINSSTVDVLMESAQFDQVATRRTARALGISTESSYRFERGVDPVGVDTASRRSIHLIQKIAGGKVAKGVLDSNPNVFTPAETKVTLKGIKRILDMDVTAEKTEAIIKSLGCEIKKSGDGAWLVKNPSWRPDLTREADYVEEIIRVIGFDKVPTTIRLKVSTVRRTKAEKAESSLRKFLLGAGFNETFTDTFLTEAQDTAFLPWGNTEPIRVKNPVREGQDVLRRSIIPSMLNVCRHNLNRGIEPVDIFDVGRAYLASGKPQPSEETIVGLASTQEFRKIKGAIAELFHRHNAPELTWVVRDVAGFEPGTSLVAEKDGMTVGVMGNVSTASAKSFDLRKPVSVAELKMSAFVNAVEQAHFTPLARFPVVVRDVAVVVDENIRWETVDAAVKKLSPALVEQLRFIETYRGKQTGEGKKSFMFEMIYRSKDRTLTDDEVNTAHAGFLEKFLPAVNGTLRA